MLLLPIFFETSVCAATLMVSVGLLDRKRGQITIVADLVKSRQSGWPSNKLPRETRISWTFYEAINFNAAGRMKTPTAYLF
jgi:hypothetical protein